MNIEERYLHAREYYKRQGIDTDSVLEKLEKIKVSIHCWQGDDVVGNEVKGDTVSAGIATSGNYLGKPNNMDQLRDDLAFALTFIPGKHKINLHAIYGDFEDGYDRNRIQPKHFKNWVEFAKKHQLGLDFNPTLFSHEMAKDNLTLSHPDANIRNFWIEHCIQSFKVANYFADELKTPVLNNIWIPDGLKDTPGNRMLYRKNLKDSLDQIFVKVEKRQDVFASLESKVFGIGLESFTVGSHEFYLQYAQENNLLCLLDNGHYHPSESVADKISSMLLFNEKIALHLTRSVRWDSDHVVLLNDEIKEIVSEIAKYDAFDRVFIGLDFFDASINRVAALVIGTRNVLKAILMGLLMPHDLLLKCDQELDYTKRLMLLEENKLYPFQDVWNYYCFKNNTVYNESWYDQVMEYEKTVLKGR